MLIGASAGEIRGSVRHRDRESGIPAFNNRVAQGVPARRPGAIRYPGLRQQELLWQYPINGKSATENQRRCPNATQKNWHLGRPLTASRLAVPESPRCRRLRIQKSASGYAMRTWTGQ